MSASIPEPEAQDLMDEALELLKAGQAEQALAIGRRLEERRYSGGFEIQALAHRDLGENKKAIKVLKKGTKRVADVWLLWQLLGNCLSDDDAYEEALAAYERALALPGAERLSLQYNRAIVLMRSEHLDEAGALLDQLLEDPEFDSQSLALKLHIEGAKLGVLMDQEDHQGAIERFEGLALPLDGAQEAEVAAQMEARYATALWRSGRAEDAERAVHRAIRLDKTNEDAQGLLRSLRCGGSSDEAICYTLMIQGPWQPDAFPQTRPAAEPPIGFFTTYQVVAEDLDEALRFIRAFEPPAVRDELVIEEVEAEEPSVEPKGVYWTSGYAFYSDD